MGFLRTTGQLARAKIGKPLVLIAQTAVGAVALSDGRGGTIQTPE
jgi:hypothetical protein